MSGRLAVVGLGPGSRQWRTPEADERLAGASDLVGYGPYLDLVGPVGDHQTLHRFDNREEARRAAFALDLAATGREVVVVSSGDPGVFAMATAVVEALHQEAANSRWAGVQLAVVPGISAAFAAAARVGAPLGHDLCLISLSDVLKPWPVVETRLSAAVSADFVLGLYNPISLHRPWQLGRALELIGLERLPGTPVILGRHLGRPQEAVTVTTLELLEPGQVDMSTVVLIGSSTTRSFTDQGGRTWVYTPRSYP